MRKEVRTSTEKDVPPGIRRAKERKLGQNENQSNGEGREDYPSHWA